MKKTKTLYYFLIYIKYKEKDLLNYIFKLFIVILFN